MKHEITIAIPVFNRAAIVCRTLDSIAAQTWRPIEVVLVDNNSSDDTLVVLQAWAARNQAPDFTVRVAVETTPGAAAARNKALEMATTPWLMYFDSDDVMARSHVERAMKTASVSGADIVGWDVAEQTGLRRRILPFRPDGDIWSSLFGGSYSTQRYMARTELFRQAGGWDSALRIWDDIELASRLLALNPVIAKSEGEPTVTVLPMPDSISVNRDGDYLDRMEAPLAKMASTLPADKRIWVDAFAAVHLGNTRRGADAALAARCDERIAALISRRTSAMHRSLLKLLYLFRRAGLRGHTHLIKPLIK